MDDPQHSAHDKETAAPSGVGPTAAPDSLAATTAFARAA